jgi:hypothetical protein
MPDVQPSRMSYGSAPLIPLALPVKIVDDVVAATHLARTQQFAAPRFARIANPGLPNEQPQAVLH